MHAMRCGAGCSSTLQWVLSLSWLGWEGTDAASRVCWWIIALQTGFLARLASVSKETDVLMYVFYMMAAIMTLLGQSRQLELERVNAEGSISTACIMQLHAEPFLPVHACA